MADIIPISVDLNKLFEAKLTYGFDPLKEAIEVGIGYQNWFFKQILSIVDLKCTLEIIHKPQSYKFCIIINLENIGIAQKPRFAEQSNERFIRRAERVIFLLYLLNFILTF